MQKAAGSATRTTAAAKKTAAKAAEPTAITSLPALKPPSCDWNFTAADKCKFHSLKTLQCDFVGCRVKFHATCKNIWEYNNNVEVDHFTKFCCNHHEHYQSFIANEREQKEQSIVDALAASAPGADKVRAMPRRGKKQNNPGR